MKNAKDTPLEPIDNRSKNGAARLRAMVEASVDCVITIDAQSTVLEFNAAAEQTFGYRRDDVIGKPLTETIIPPSLREGHRMGMAALLKGGTSKLLGKRVEMPAMRSDGSEFPVELTVTQIAGQTPPIFTAYLRDITERKLVEAALRQSEAHTRLLVKSSNVGLWDWNLVTNEVFFSPEWKRQLGCSDDELPNHYEEWERRLHPEDREPTLRAVQDFHEGRRADYDVEFRLRHKDGSWRWILTRADLIRDAAGQPVRMMGCHIDISARKQAEKKLRESETRFRLMFEKSGVGMALTTVDSIFLQANGAFCALLGRTEEEVIGHSSAEFTHPEDVAKTLRPDTEVREDGVHIIDLEKRYVRKDGATLWAHVTAVLHFDENAQPLYYIAIVEDITDRKEAEEQILAQLDELRRWQEVTLGREDRVLELKREVNKLHQQLGEPARYPSQTQP